MMLYTFYLLAAMGGGRRVGCEAVRDDGNNNKNRVIFLLRCQFRVRARGILQIDRAGNR